MPIATARATTPASATTQGRGPAPDRGRHRAEFKSAAAARLERTAREPTARAPTVPASGRQPRTLAAPHLTATMQYTKLGRTGLDVSRLCLGCMSYGEPGARQHPWTLDEAASRPFIRRALDARHQLLRHRERLFRRHQRGDRRPRAARVRAPRRGGHRHQGARPHAQGPQRRRLVAQGDPGRDRRQPEAARHRLRRPVPDPPLGPGTPIEETLEALHDVVKAGKARYIGASSMHAWQFSKALHLADEHGWTRFVIDAEPLQPALPRGGARDAAALPRRGRRRDPVEPARARPADARLGRGSARAETDEFGKHPLCEDRRRRSHVVERVAEVAACAACRARRSRSPGCCASRRSRRRSSARRKLEQLDDAVAALDLELSAEEVAALEEPYRPHAVVGHF